MAFRIPILLYHDLDADDFPNEKLQSAAKNTVVRHRNFEEQMKYFFDHKYRTIGLDEYFFFIKNNKPLPPKTIIITFDDGHYSNYFLAYPILLKYHYKATFFIVANRINQPYHLTAEQIFEMASNGMEIGSHGVSHQYLPLLSPGEIHSELVESQQKIQALANRSVNYFAFPGGHFNKRVLSILKSSNYVGACSCIQGTNSAATNPYLLRRIEIRRNAAEGDLKSIFNPFHIAFYQTIDSGKSLVKRTIGLARYTKLRARYSKYYIFKR